MIAPAERWIQPTCPNELFDHFFHPLRCWNVHKLAHVVNDMRANEHETTKVATIDASDCDWRTVEFVVRKLLDV